MIVNCQHLTTCQLLYHVHTPLSLSTHTHTRAHTSLSTHTHTHTYSHLSLHTLTAPSPVSGRYLFLNAIANQLCYPNSHTHYFSCTLVSLFVETNAEAIQEQITRVLLERLIVIACIHKMILCSYS